MQLEFKKNHPIFWLLNGTHCVKYDNFRIFSLTLAHFLFHKNLFYGFCWICLCYPVTKIQPKKTLLESMQKIIVIHKVRKT